VLKVSQRMREGMQRLRRAAAGKADCVPVVAQISHHAARLLGESTRKFYTDAETFVRCELHADELYEIDAPGMHYDHYNIEAEALGAEFVWNPDEAPEADPAHRLLQSVDDWRKLKPIRVGAAGRMPFALEINRRLVDLGLAPTIRFCGPVTLAAKLLGLERLVIACRTEPESVHALMTFLTDDVLAPWIVCQREQSGRDEIASGGDAYASPPILSVPMAREFCLRYVQRLERLVGGVRMYALWGERHLDNPRDLLDLKRECCPGAIQALDPDATVLGPALFRQYADEHDMAVVAGLDAGLVEQGPVDAIRTRVRRFIDEAGRDGRFILFLNDVAYRTPPEHVHAAVAVAHGHRY